MKKNQIRVHIYLLEKSHTPSFPLESVHLFVRPAIVLFRAFTDKENLYAFRWFGQKSSDFLAENRSIPWVFIKRCK